MKVTMMIRLMVLAVVVLYAYGYGDVIVDQSQREYDYSNDFVGVKQTFTTGMDGLLVGISVKLIEEGGNKVGSDIVMKLLPTDDEGYPIDEEVLAEGRWACSGIRDGLAKWATVYFDEPYVQETGELLAFHCYSTSGGGQNGWNMFCYFQSEDLYPFGGFALGKLDLAFETFVDPDMLIKLQAPNGGEYYKSGEEINILWRSNGLDAAKVDIYYSTNDGARWTLLAGGTQNDGVYTWKTDSAIDSEQCLVKVVNTSGTSMYDVSEGVFTIYPCSFALTGDLNGDCFVDVGDLLVFSQQWLTDGFIED